jgi:hypothetical protein
MSDSWAGMTRLEPDAEDIARFVAALFRRADPDTFVPLRAFAKNPDGADEPWPSWREWIAVPVAAVLTPALNFARRCANADRPVVFCPPVATFNNRLHARVVDLANGLALSVECDQRAQAARLKLELGLGPATVVVASGGEWVDPETGEVEAKLHLHWRLATPTRSPEEHEGLRRAREAATRYVGADASNIALVHPIRWPGSWHRKGAPRLARIVGGDPEREISLKEAIAALVEVVEVSNEERVAGEPESDIEDVAMWLDVIPNRGPSGGKPSDPSGHDDDFGGYNWYDWNRVGMATWRATGGSVEGRALFESWSDKFEVDGVKGVKGRQTAKSRWEHYDNSPPTEIGAGTLAYLAAVFWVEPEVGDPAAWDEYLRQGGELL